MSKKLLILIFAILFGGYAMAYDFSTEYSNGQILSTITSNTTTFNTIDFFDGDTIVDFIDMLESSVAYSEERKIYYCNNDFQVNVTYSKENPIVTYFISLSFYIYDAHYKDYYEGTASIIEDVIVNKKINDVQMIDSLKSVLLGNLSSGYTEYDVVLINSEQMKVLRNLQNDEDNEEYGGIHYNYEWKYVITEYNDYFYCRYYQEIIDADTRWYDSCLNYFDSKTDKRIESENIFSIEGMNLMLRYMTADFSEWISDFIDDYTTYLDFLTCMKQRHFIFDESVIGIIEYNEDGIHINSVGAGDSNGAHVLEMYLDEELCDNAGDSKCNICPIEKYILLCTACNYEVSFTAEECLMFFKPESPMYKYYMHKSNR